MLLAFAQTRVPGQLLSGPAAGVLMLAPSGLACLYSASSGTSSHVIWQRQLTSTPDSLPACQVQSEQLHSYCSRQLQPVLAAKPSIRHQLNMISRITAAARHSCVACLLLVLLYGGGLVAAQSATPQTSAALPLDDASCPITSQDFSNTDFDSVRTACDIDAMTNGQFCKSCVCGLGTAIVLGFEKAGIKVNGQPVSALAAAGDIDALNGLLNNCSAIMGIELLQAGALTAQALGQLADCNVNQTTLDCAAAAGGSTPGAAAAPQAEASQGSGQTPTAAPAAPAKSNGGAGRDVSVLGTMVAMVVGLAAIL